MAGLWLTPKCLGTDITQMYRLGCPFLHLGLTLWQPDNKLFISINGVVYLFGLNSVFAWDVLDKNTLNINDWRISKRNEVWGRKTTGQGDKGQWGGRWEMKERKTQRRARKNDWRPETGRWVPSATGEVVVCPRITRRLQVGSRGWTLTVGWGKGGPVLHPNAVFSSECISFSRLELKPRDKEIKLGPKQHSWRYRTQDL